VRRREQPPTSRVFAPLRRILLWLWHPEFVERLVQIIHEGQPFFISDDEVSQGRRATTAKQISIECCKRKNHQGDKTFGSESRPL
jgi:hypothetical protein